MKFSKEEQSISADNILDYFIKCQNQSQLFDDNFQGDPYPNVALFVANAVLHFVFGKQNSVKSLKELVNITTLYENDLHKMKSVQERSQEMINRRIEMINTLHQAIQPKLPLDYGNDLKLRRSFDGALLRTFLNSFAGVATSMQWLLLLLGKHQDWQTKLRHEKVSSQELYGFIFCLLYTSPSPRDRG